MASRDLSRLQRTWDRHGRQDPFWAVLTFPGTKGNRWDAASLFATGVSQVDALMEHLASMGARPSGGSALDFGCGVGRLTQALAPHFERVLGVDIAPSMIEAAERLNAHGDRVAYVLNSRPDLATFGDATFDFVISYVTLQHIPEKEALGYVRELIRILKPGAIGVLQAPASPAHTPSGLVTALIPAAIRSRIRDMEMHAISRAKMETAISAAGATIMDAQKNQAAGPRWISITYTIRKLSS
jgi:2-polyprenyl-3-methyl-5-hydroxy-6-metoxy-1,4-benzoquinol methylase